MRILFMGTDDVAVPSLAAVNSIEGVDIDVLCPSPRERFGGKKQEVTAVQQFAIQ